MADNDELIDTQTLDADETTTLDQLDPITGLNNNDLVYVHTDSGSDAKATAKQFKDFIYPPEADSLTTGLVNTSAQAFAGKKTFNGGLAAPNITVTSRLDVNGDIYQNGEPFTPGGGGSALVPSMTQAEYDEIEDKEDGQIREITDAEGTPVPFAILNDSTETSSNVWSAQKVNNTIKAVDGKNDYSTTEKVVGNFLDKPRYRKVFSGLNINTSSDSATTLLTDTTISIIDDLVMCIGIGTEKGENKKCTTTFTKAFFGSGTLKTFSNVGFTINKLILEYTKTTD